MFSPDDLTPVLVAVPYITALGARTLGRSVRRQILLRKPGWCNYLPWFCR